MYGNELPVIYGSVVRRRFISTGSSHAGRDHRAEISSAGPALELIFSFILTVIIKKQVRGKATLIKRGLYDSG